MCNTEVLVSHGKSTGSSGALGKTLNLPPFSWPCQPCVPTVCGSVGIFSPPCVYLLSLVDKALLLWFFLVDMVKHFSGQPGTPVLHLSVHGEDDASQPNMLRANYRTRKESSITFLCTNCLAIHSRLMLAITNADPAALVSVAFKVVRANFHSTLTWIDIYTGCKYSVHFQRLIAGISFPILA